MYHFSFTKKFMSRQPCKTCSCPLVLYFGTLFWDDVTIFSVQSCKFSIHFFFRIFRACLWAWIPCLRLTQWTGIWCLIWSMPFLEFTEVLDNVNSALTILLLQEKKEEFCMICQHQVRFFSNFSKNSLKTQKKAFFACFWAYVVQSLNHIGWATSMPFASINQSY